MNYCLFKKLQNNHYKLQCLKDCLPISFKCKLPL